MANTKIPVELSSTPSISDSGDATAITINSSEDVFVGSGTSNGISGGTAGLQVSGAGFKGAISASRHDNNQYGSSLMLGKSRNTTVGSNTIVQNNDIIGAVTFFADDGTNLDSRVANISAAVDGTPSENDTPGRLVFETTADGSAAPTERMRIDSSGNIGVATSSPTHEIDLTKTLTSINDNPTLQVKNAWSGEGNNVGFDNKAIALFSAGNDTVITRIQSRYDSGANFGEIGTQTNHDFLLTTNNTERFRIFQLSRPSYSFGTTSTSTTQGPAMYAASTSPSNNTHLWFHFLEAKNHASAAGIKVGGLLASSSYAIADPIRGAIYAQGDVSAQTFTDRTPYPTSLQLAKDVINSHQRRSEEEITRVATEQYNKIQEKSDMPQPEMEALSLEEFLDKHKKEYELDHSILHDYVSDTKYAENGIEGRDASATISCLVEVVKDLMKRIETLEGS
mgnify:CR=1 FL=1|tara:strand:+ start:933 stop:2288 length:1356 start_codon:yes stop_codon:yes gene_type:complete